MIDILKAVLFLNIFVLSVLTIPFGIGIVGLLFLWACYREERQNEIMKEERLLKALRDIKDSIND